MLAAFAPARGASAEPNSVGPATGLPVPRFVSLKPSDTPMREGPSKEHRIKWVFKREGLPVVQVDMRSSAATIRCTEE